ncbi:hypothetical protein V1478_005655 [Vespula squamosa]|uniref:Uncharacterized protein n=1 Tax=Vespula squamosa TaxID=30214 RepID=A0ABD2BAA1_VESSQ
MRRYILVEGIDGQKWLIEGNALPTNSPSATFEGAKWSPDVIFTISFAIRFSNFFPITKNAGLGYNNF